MLLFVQTSIPTQKPTQTSTYRACGEQHALYQFEDARWTAEVVRTYRNTPTFRGQSAQVFVYFQEAPGTDRYYLRANGDMVEEVRTACGATLTQAMHVLSVARQKLSVACALSNALQTLSA
jgi:hypothetical protein